MKRIILFLAILPVVATGQTVYKCTVNGQTAYQQQPCADNARSEQLQFRQSGDTTQTNNDAYQKLSRNVKLTDIANDADECMTTARSRVWGQANRRIARLDAQIQRLRYNIQRANNNAAGASWESGLRSEIAGLEQAIATERTSADGLVMEAEQRCLDQRDQRTDAAKAQFEREDEARQSQQQQEQKSE